MQEVSRPQERELQESRREPLTVRMRALPFALLIVALAALSLTGGVFLDRQVLLSNGYIPTNAQSSFKLIAEAWNTIQGHYVDRSAVKDTPLTYGAISGMTDSLGDTGHSTFLSPQMVNQEKNYIQGQFEGIGAEIGTSQGHVVIIAPLDGSPAQKAGLKPGDILLKVNGEEITGLSLSAVASKVSGPAGTDVNLTIQDPNTGQTRQVTITRAHVQVNNVTWRMLPGTHIAHVRIAGFSEGVTKDLEGVLKQAKAQGAEGLILDLRSNPGGLLSQAVGVSSQFLSSGNVLIEKNAQGDETAVPIEGGGAATDIPMVVLINGGTASASEIVAGALQDHQRATLVGETTFGTGTVLNKFPLSDGSALLLATEEWLTPNGRVIWHQGITPDVKVSLAQDASPLVPEAEADMSPAQLQNSGDAQLLRGLKLLTSPGAS
jgi:carboxyl-terminal processing protease